MADLLCPRVSADPAEGARHLTDDERALVLRIALRLSKERNAPTYDGTKNKQGEWHSLEFLVSHDLPFYVRLQEDVLGVDFDKPGSLEGARTLAHLLHLEGFLPVVVASGGVSDEGEPRCHVYAAIDDPSAHARWLAKGKAMGGDNRGTGTRTLRPPGTLHRKRVARSWPMYPPTLDDVAQRLSKRRPPSRAVRESVRRLIRNGAEPGNDRSAVLATVVLALHRAKWTHDEILDLLTCPEFGIARTYAEVREDRSFGGDEYFERHLWGYAEKHPPASSARVRKFRAYGRQVILHSSNVKSRAACIAVFEAVLTISERSGKAVVDASLRDLSFGAQVASLGTVNTALLMLCRLGLLNDVTQPLPWGLKRGPMRMANTYEIVYSSMPSLWSIECEPLEFVTHESFRDRTGLGKWVGVAYQALWNSPGQTIDDLVGVLNRSRKAVTRDLKQLQMLDMAKVRDGRWYPGDVLPTEGQLPSAAIAAQRDRDHASRDRKVVLTASAAKASLSEETPGGNNPANAPSP